MYFCNLLCFSGRVNTLHGGMRGGPSWPVSQAPQVPSSSTPPLLILVTQLPTPECRGHAASLLSSHILPIWPLPTSLFIWCHCLDSLHRCVLSFLCVLHGSLTIKSRDLFSRNDGEQNEWSCIFLRLAVARMKGWGERWTLSNVLFATNSTKRSPISGASIKEVSFRFEDRLICCSWRVCVSCEGSTVEW